MDLERSLSASSQFPAGGEPSAAPPRDRWDQALGAAMRDVPVPADLKQRILSRLEPAVALQVEEVAGSVRRRSRLARRSVQSAGLALLVLGAAWLAGWLTPAARPTLAVTDLLSASWDVAALPAYAGSTTPAWPDGWKSVAGLKLQGWKAGPLPGRTDGAAIAVAGFEFRHRQGAGKVHGELLLAPRGWVSQPPAAMNMQQGEIRYHGPNGFVAWTEGETVYVCLLHSDPGALDVLRQAIANARPVT